MEDRLEALESAIYALDDAIEAIEALGKHSENDVMCLRDIRRDYQTEASEIHAELEAASAAEESALEREYWKAVI